MAVDFGIDHHGTVSIPAHMLDQLDNGNFTAYLKKSDFFYFLNEDYLEQNRFIKGSTLIKQLSAKNGETILRKNPHISALDRLVDELNFLSANGVTNSDQFYDLAERFADQLEKTDQELEHLDYKLHDLNLILGALTDTQEIFHLQADPLTSYTAVEILERFRIDPKSDPLQVKKEIKEVHIERNALKNHRDAIVADYTLYNEMKVEKEQSVQKRKISQ